jgi:predicted dehydrogenase
MTIGVVVVGLGRIGAGYRERTSSPPRTHVSAILATPGLDLRAVVDPDCRARAAAVERFPRLASARQASTLAELPAGVAEIITLATPSGEREKAVNDAMVLKPRLLFAEKPLADSLAAAQRIVERLHAAELPLRVNFHRRFDPGHDRMRRIFEGRPRAIQVRYTKGLLNYGSHIIDLLVDWFGPIVAARADAPSPADGDPRMNFAVRFGDGLEATAIALEDVTYDAFDVDLLYGSGRIELSAGGFGRRVWRPVAGLHYDGYAHLAVDANASEESAVGGIAEFYAAAGSHLEKGTTLAGCDGAAALHGLAVIEAVRRSAATGGVWQKPQVPPAAS